MAGGSDRRVQTESTQPRNQISPDVYWRIFQEGLGRTAQRQDGYISRERFRIHPALPSEKVADGQGNGIPQP